MALVRSARGQADTSGRVAIARHRKPAPTRLVQPMRLAVLLQQVQAVCGWGGDHLLQPRHVAPLFIGKAGGHDLGSLLH